MEVNPTTSLQLLGPPDRCRAFVTHLTPGLDLTDIPRFASLTIPMNYRWVFEDEVGERQLSIVDKAVEVFDANGGFNSDTDYLVLGGDPLMALAVVFWLAKRHDRVTVLRYDRRTFTYFPFILGM